MAKMGEGGRGELSFLTWAMSSKYNGFSCVWSTSVRDTVQVRGSQEVYQNGKMIKGVRYSGVGLHDVKLHLLPRIKKWYLLFMCPCGWENLGTILHTLY